MRPDAADRPDEETRGRTPALSKLILQYKGLTVQATTRSRAVAALFLVGAVVIMIARPVIELIR